MADEVVKAARDELELAKVVEFVPETAELEEELVTAPKAVVELIAEELEPYTVLKVLEFEVVTTPSAELLDDVTVAGSVELPLDVVKLLKELKLEVVTAPDAELVLETTALVGAVTLTGGIYVYPYATNELDDDEVAPPRAVLFEEVAVLET